jgi:hypothetical protein
MSAFVADIFGVSGRLMLHALIDGERDPQVLAELARARMRGKIPALVEALTGRFDEHHAFLTATMLARIDALDASVDDVTARIEIEIAPLQPIVDRLDTIPGVNVRVAQTIVAEIGVDMSRFPSAAHLASWAGLCPGNNESAGKHFSGRARKGDTWLRAALGEAAVAASRSKGTYLQARYRRLAFRRGKKRALVAVSHTMITAAWQMITNDLDYQDLGSSFFTDRLDRQRHTRHLVSQLQQLGYRVQLDTPLSAPVDFRVSGSTRSAAVSARIGRDECVIVDLVNYPQTGRVSASVAQRYQHLADCPVVVGYFALAVRVAVQPSPERSGDAQGRLIAVMEIEHLCMSWCGCSAVHAVTGIWVQVVQGCNESMGRGRSQVKAADQQTLNAAGGRVDTSHGEHRLGGHQKIGGTRGACARRVKGGCASKCVVAGNADRRKHAVHLLTRGCTDPDGDGLVREDYDAGDSLSETRLFCGVAAPGGVPVDPRGRCQDTGVGRFATAARQVPARPRTRRARLLQPPPSVPTGTVPRCGRRRRRSRVDPSPACGSWLLGVPSRPRRGRCRASWTAGPHGLRR